MYKDASSNDNLTVNIGLIGLGYIGSEVFKLIHEQHDYIMKKIGKDLKITVVAEKDLESRKELIKKYKGIRFTDNPYEAINDESIDIIVELIGGIEPAFEYIT